MGICSTKAGSQDAQFFLLCDWFLLNINQSQNTEERKKAGILLWSDFSKDEDYSFAVTNPTENPKKSFLNF